MIHMILLIGSALIFSLCLVAILIFERIMESLWKKGKPEDIWFTIPIMQRLQVKCGMVMLVCLIVFFFSLKNLQNVTN